MGPDVLHNTIYSRTGYLCIFARRLSGLSWAFKMKHQKIAELGQLKKRFNKISFPQKVGNLDVRNEIDFKFKVKFT